uniref:Uncharacterized protein n=1 Tax=Sinocyclocheilus grahami TaxID=75366 RepID=A0A672LZT2_SINGR
MSWPFSSLFSHSTRRSRFEMSKISPTAAVSTPPVPRFCSRKFSRIFPRRGSYRQLFALDRFQHWIYLISKSSHYKIKVIIVTLLSFGKRTCTPALRPVPRLDGQVRM